MANVTTTTATKHIPEVWPRDVIRAQEFKLIIAPRVFRDWKFVGFGDVYHVPRIPNLTANTKSAGSAWTPEALTDTEQQITINVHQVAGVEVESIAELLTSTNMSNEYKRKIGYALGRAVDVNLATLPTSFSQSVGALGSEVVYADMVDAWNFLADTGIELQDQCTWFLSPGAIGGLLKQDIIISQMYQGDNPRAVQTAKVSDLLGAPILQTNLTKAPTSSQSDSFLVYKQAMALIMAMEPKMVAEMIAKDLADVIGGHQIYGFAEINRYDETPANVTASDKWAVHIKTAA
ncbi:hypothetical protein LCGC14_2015810 [marine sediment metagenome]|uniref:Uncharacterized protein n=1 Tax=marine sediment metagenome TaxID=412755 RepID=A0A0F9HW62_9ZZZZ